jgi:hypothetical protein
MAVSVMAVVMLCATLAVIASCRTTTPRPDPLQAIYPPGYVSNAIPPPPMLANVPRPRLSAFLPSPGVPVTMTFDPGQGPADGIHVYRGFNANSMQLIGTWGPTNIFTLNLPTNLPSLVEVHTFINWPSPGVVGSVTLDDGTIENFTNTFYESPGAQMIFVPSNCPAIGLFLMPSGMVLAGWNSGTNLEVQSSADLVNWTEIAHVTTPGAWQIQVDGSQQAMGFWRTKQ